MHFCFGDEQLITKMIVFSHSIYSHFLLHPPLEAKENAAKAKVPLSSTLPAEMTCSRNLTHQYDDDVASSLEMALLETEDRLQEKRDEAQRPDDILVSQLQMK